MRGSSGAGRVTAALIVLGLAPVVLSPSLGTLVTIGGIVLLIAFLVVVFRDRMPG